MARKRGSKKKSVARKTKRSRKTSVKQEKKSAGERGLCAFLRSPKWMFLLLLWYFCALAVLFSIVDFGRQMYYILAVSAIGFAALEFKLNWKGKTTQKLKDAALVGIFLLALDLVFENAGAAFGLWAVRWGLVMFGAVPVEIVIVTLFGGFAWALYMPAKFNFRHSLLDAAMFAFFGTFGEFLLIQGGLMSYYSWWNPALAFVSYAGAWALLNFVRYKVVEEV